MDLCLFAALQLRTAGQFCRRTAADAVLRRAVAAGYFLAIQSVSRHLAVREHYRPSPYLSCSHAGGGGDSTDVLDVAPGFCDTPLSPGHQPAVVDPDDGRQPLCLSALERAGVVCRHQAAWRTGAGSGRG